jgi:hypothetical protein
MRQDVETQLAKALRHPDGWWVRAVLDSFDPIAKGFGYSVGTVAMHFRGHVVLYLGSTYGIDLTFDREGRHPYWTALGPRRSPAGTLSARGLHSSAALCSRTKRVLGSARDRTRIYSIHGPFRSGSPGVWALDLRS